MEVEKFFPEIIGSIKIKYTNQQLKNLKTIAKHLEYQPMYADAATDKKEKNLGKGETSTLIKCLDHPKLPSFKETLNQALNMFTKDVMQWNTGAMVVNSWYNKIKPNQDTEIIKQKNSIITMVLFFEYEKDQPHLIFEKNVKGFEPSIKTFNSFNTTKAALIPQPGTLYFISSNLDFKFSVNKSKKIHNNIMCSTMPVGVMGADTTTLALNVNKDQDMYKKIVT
tara:strand:- start:193 stop:864 length:672 start_codon:yes stop_codon:yes gene_type:complete